MVCRSGFYGKIGVFLNLRVEKNAPFRYTRQKGAFYEIGLTNQKKTTDIWFDEKNSIIHINYTQYGFEKQVDHIQPTAPHSL